MTLPRFKKMSDKMTNGGLSVVLGYSLLAAALTTTFYVSAKSEVKNAKARPGIVGKGVLYERLSEKSCRWVGTSSPLTTEYLPIRVFTSATEPCDAQAMQTYKTNVRSRSEHQAGLE